MQFDFRSSFKDDKADDRLSNILNVCMELIEYKFIDEKAGILSKQLGKSIICFVMADNLNQLKLQKWIDYIHTTISQYFNIEFKSINIPIETTMEEAREHLDWLYEGSDYMFYLSNGDHLTKDKMYKEDGHFAYDTEEVNKICSYIEDADNEGLWSLIKEIEDILDVQRGNSLEVKLELSFMIKDVLSRMDVTSEYERDTIEIQKKIMKAEELKETMQIIQAFLHTVMLENAKSRNDSTDFVIKKALQYIEENCSEKISLDEIADYVGISKYYFSVLFKKETGTTFSNHLNTVRIDNAKQIVKNSNITVMDAAHAVGFNDYSYFCKTFKKYTGLTVTEYRSKSIK